ncbi:putative hydroxyacid oxidase 2-like [Penaeus vannamei]|uniref:Putative hydroxyacid oxidase 2-like n=1 Tax=Penaeus vannamei TaxID=6689 RepID=A0A3R7N2J4_PENVA|nr:putative hydroxyacid oxidase 2-like [Penaeus vannamei]
MSDSEFFYDPATWSVNKQMVEAYEKNGYVLVRNMLSEAEIQKLRTAVESSKGIQRHAYGRSDGDRKSRMCVWNHPGDDITGVLARSPRVPLLCSSLSLHHPLSLLSPSPILLSLLHSPFSDILHPSSLFLLISLSLRLFSALPSFSPPLLIIIRFSALSLCSLFSFTFLLPLCPLSLCPPNSPLPLPPLTSSACSFLPLFSSFPSSSFLLFSLSSLPLSSSLLSFSSPLSHFRSPLLPSATLLPLFTSSTLPSSPPLPPLPLP